MSNGSTISECIIDYFIWFSYSKICNFDSKMYKATSVTNNPLVYPHQFFSFC